MEQVRNKQTSLRVKNRLNTEEMLKILEDLVKMGLSNGSLIALQKKVIPWGENEHISNKTK